MPDLGRAWDFLEASDLVCGEREVQGAIARLAEQIGAQLHEQVGAAGQHSCFARLSRQQGYRLVDGVRRLIPHVP